MKQHTFTIRYTPKHTHKCDGLSKIVGTLHYIYLINGGGGGCVVSR